MHTVCEFITLLYWSKGWIHLQSTYVYVYSYVSLIGRQSSFRHMGASVSDSTKWDHIYFPSAAQYYGKSSTLNIITCSDKDKHACVLFSLFLFLLYFSPSFSYCFIYSISCSIAVLQKLQMCVFSCSFKYVWAF